MITTILLVIVCLTFLVLAVVCGRLFYTALCGRTKDSTVIFLFVACILSFAISVGTGVGTAYSFANGLIHAAKTH